MPRVTSYTPPWLCRPSPGFDVFNPNKNKQASTNLSTGDGAPSRTIARRGTEIFVSHGNEIRWSDLVLLKDKWEVEQSQLTGQGDSEEESYLSAPFRVLKSPVHRKIEQLVVSPEGEYLAILTTHTIHVAVLPDPSHLTSDDTSPLKLKTFHLGPTTHVLEQSPIAAAVWHPLGIKGGCLVTITVDAVLRLWELDISNRWSFDEPAMALSLSKLADSKSTAEDVTPSKYGTNKGFSPDSVDMEVSSACFGGEGMTNECGWAATTLWIGVKHGDIYALCPLLPSKWEAYPELTESIYSAVLSKSDESIPKQERDNYEQQKTWVLELRKQPQKHADSESFEPDVEMYRRPQYPGTIPKLQGPFRFTPEVDEILDETNIVDIYSVPAIEHEDLQEFSPSPQEMEERATLPMNMLCIATEDGKVHVCVDLAGVEGQWLPSKQSKFKHVQTKGSPPALLLLESIALGDPSAKNSLLFTDDEQSQYSFFVTHGEGVSYLSLWPWVERMSQELVSASNSGSEVRLDILFDNTHTLVEHPIRLSAPPEDQKQQLLSIPACISLVDSDLGFFVLTAAFNQPQAAILEDSEPDLGLLTDDAPEEEQDEALQRLIRHESRPSYQPPDELWAASRLSSIIDAQLHSRHRRAMREEVRLSPLTFNLIRNAHVVLSDETNRLGLAASDLFSRCARMQDEFREQLRRANDVAARIESLFDEPDDAAALDSAREGIEARLAAVTDREATLQARYAELRRKLGGLHDRPLSEKEGVWVADVAALARLVGVEANGGRAEEDEAPAAQPWKRYKAVSKMHEHFLAQSKELRRAADDEQAKAAGEAERRSPMRRTGKRSMAQVHAMLERQTALLDGTKTRVERLNAMSR